MPQNCSADVEAVVAHFDAVFTSTNTTAIDELKASFGLGELTHLDDVVGARELLSLCPQSSIHFSNTHLVDVVQSNTLSMTGKTYRRALALVEAFTSFVTLWKSRMVSAPLKMDGVSTMRSSLGVITSLIRISLRVSSH